MRVCSLWSVSVMVLLVLLCVCPSASANNIAKYNKRVGSKYLEENAAKEGVIVLPSGLQYKVLESGSGSDSPSANDQVKVHYRGTLINGKEFDSSYSRGQPATFGVSGVIKGWTEALQLMHAGDVWELYIPSDLAYGERGSGKDIGPHSTLVFKVELIEILGKAGGAPPKPKKTPPPPKPAEL